VNPFSSGILGGEPGMWDWLTTPAPNLIRQEYNKKSMYRNFMSGHISDDRVSFENGSIESNGHESNDKIDVGMVNMDSLALARTLVTEGGGECFEYAIQKSIDLMKSDLNVVIIDEFISETADVMTAHRAILSGTILSRFSNQINQNRNSSDYMKTTLLASKFNSWGPILVICKGKNLKTWEESLGVVFGVCTELLRLLFFIFFHMYDYSCMIYPYLYDHMYM
jgi:hypothetical protein